MSNLCNELIEIDNVENGVFVTKNGEETKFLSLVSDDDDDDNERIEFDTTKLIKSPKHSTKNSERKFNDYKEYREYSGSSNTSGVHSANISI